MGEMEEKSISKRTRLGIIRENGTVIAVSLIIIMAMVSVWLFHNAVHKGAEALADSYNASFSSSRENTYQNIYQKYYEDAEAKYHVTNRVSIEVDSLRETDKLEVLRVRDMEFVEEERQNVLGKMASWLKVPGEGIFSVDLSVAEFVVDNERARVKVRLPYPELTNVKIDYSDVEKILFKDDRPLRNGSYREGEELAVKQLGEADVLIKKEFASNQHFYLNAQKSAESTIQCLVRQLNPNVENLKVEVEFY